MQLNTLKINFLGLFPGLMHSKNVNQGKTAQKTEISYRNILYNKSEGDIRTRKDFMKENEVMKCGTNVKKTLLNLSCQLRIIMRATVLKLLAVLSGLSFRLILIARILVFSRKTTEISMQSSNIV